MRRILKVLMVSCFCAIFVGIVTAHGTAEKSPRTVMLVTAQADYANIAVSQVSDYVNIREQAGTGSKIVGKIYNNCAASILETVEGEDGTWYRIQSGSVNGFIKAQYFVTGKEAEELAQSIGRRFVTINTESLRLREQPDLTSNTLTLLSQGARYVVQGEAGDFYKVEVDSDLVGYIAQAYCKTEVEFDQAVSLEEERQRLEEEAARRREAESAIAALEQVKRVEAKKEGASANHSMVSAELIIAENPEKSDNSQRTTAPVIMTTADSTGNKGVGVVNAGTIKEPGSAAVASATRTAIVAYAKQFLGNPYVYGGSSLTDGADCSGFTQSVYAHFGIATGRSSRDQAAKGKEISVGSVQPGDLLFYASGNYINHVALYIGGGQVIHASNPTTGIIISPYNYRTPCKAVTFLN